MPSNPVRPKILGFISEQASPWVVAITALVLGAVLTIILALANFELYKRQLVQRFGLLASEHFSRIQERLDSQVYRLDSLRRFFVFSDLISRAEFNGFAAPLLIGTQAYSWAPKVVGTEREHFERQAIAEGISSFSVRELDAGGGLQPAGIRSEYFPVFFTQSRSTLPVPLGFDIASERARDQALERARQLGAMVVTSRLHLVGLEPANATGILLLAPVFAGNARFSTAQEDVSGFVMAVISLSALMTEGLPTQENLAVTLRDLAAPDQPEPLYESSTAAGESDLRVSTLLNFADRNYFLEIRPAQAFLNSNQSQRVNVILLGGLLSVMLSALLYSLVGQRQRALRLVDQRTSELRQREQQLRGSHGQLRNVLNAATEVAIIATDLNGVISTFNVGAQKMLGYGNDEVVGRFTLKDLHVTSELEEHAQRLSIGYGTQVSANEAIFIEASQESIHQSREWTFVRRDGSTLSVNMLVTAVRDEQGQWVGYLAVCIDITERKRVEEELRRLAVTDSLTGAFNRRYFQERFAVELGRVQGNGGALSVIMLDIDHFKRINDELGHAMGDWALQAISQRISLRLRRNDVFCRLGGEEFMVLCPGTDAITAYQLALELWRELRSQPVDGVGVITASFGVAGWREGEGDDALLLRVDSRVYAAKQAGRDRVEPERL